ncbi:hypothetical protein SK128_005082 [Halocaridina rubra]|uniref:Uncharacterized protein n=1 Tax=Halocaridina rubra TaxID=373956 RepID=A0AAN8X0V3_HALRR
MEFAPFNLLFCRQIRGPLNVVNDQWLNDEDTPLTVTKFNDIVSDAPKLCPYIKHDIQLMPDTSPMLQPAYRLDPKKEIMHAKVDYLLQHGSAAPSILHGFLHLY